MLTIHTLPVVAAAAILLAACRQSPDDAALQSHSLRKENTMSTPSSGSASSAWPVIPALPSPDWRPDGVPDEPFWQKAAVLEAKRLFRKDNQFSAVTTRFRFCTDPRNLYIAAECGEPAGVNRDDPDDRPWSSDSVEIFLAGGAHPAWFRQLVVGANGGKFSRMIHESQWQAAVACGEGQWSAEIAVPLEMLGALDRDDLCLNMLRTRRNVREIITWQPLRARALEVENFGRVVAAGAPDAIRHAPWLFRIKNDGAGIAWETVRSAAPGGVFFRERGSARWSEAAARSHADARVHSVRLAGLKADTAYEYWVPGMKDIGSFRTLSEQSEECAFALTSDVHCRAFQLRKMLERPDVQACDLFILLGDQIDASEAREYHFDGFLNVLKEHWPKPFYCVYGNHEGRGEAKDSFYDLFAGGQKAGYDAFLHKGVFFVILDTDRDFAMSEEYRQEQIRFLRETVRSEAFQKAQYRVLLQHVPMAFAWRRWGTENYAVFSALPPEAQKAFDLALAGHIHEYTRTLPGDKTVFSREKSVHGLPAVRSLAFPEFVVPELALVLLRKNDREMVLEIFDQYGKKIVGHSVKARNGR